MATKTRRVKLSVYLKRDGVQQTQVAELFDKSQPWLNQIKQRNPDATLVFEDGEIKRLEFSYKKVFERVK